VTLISCDPALGDFHLCLLQAVVTLATAVQRSKEAVLWCKERAARAGDRAAVLAQAMQEMVTAVLAPGQGVKVSQVESISGMLVLLAKVWLHPGVGTNQTYRHSHLLFPAC
jgi:hypothetical protein